MYVDFESISVIIHILDNWDILIGKIVYTKRNDTMLIKFIVCLVAGIGAGLGTGFAGMSAAAVISPMLITFLDMDPYMAVGIALASDVLASAASAYTYGKNKNIDIKNGIVMMIFFLLFIFGY